MPRRSVDDLLAFIEVVGPSAIGNPHDAMYPLHRFVHWMAHEDGCAIGR
jgi:hypothetical protein